MAAKMDSGSPRGLGVFLIALGLALTGGGIYLLTLGGSLYFLTIGIGLLASGVLLAMGKKAGVAAYTVTLAIIIGWSILETGGDVNQLLPRLLLPVIIAVYLSQAKVRATLT